MRANHVPIVLRIHPHLLAKIDAKRGHLSRTTALRLVLTEWAKSSRPVPPKPPPKPKPVDWQAVVNSLPHTITRQHAAQIISTHLFPITARSLERWPLPKVRGGYAYTTTCDVIRIAVAKVKHGGRYGRMDECKQIPLAGQLSQK